MSVAGGEAPAITRTTEGIATTAMKLSLISRNTQTEKLSAQFVKSIGLTT